MKLVELLPPFKNVHIDINYFIMSEELTVESCLLQKQREEILSHQPDFDRFTDDAQNLMHTSADVRLSTHVSQLTNRYRGLLSLIKDLIGKWDKYAQDHHAYENRQSEFRNWLVQAEEKLETCQQPAADQDTMEEKKAVIQVGWGVIGEFSPNPSAFQDL